MKTFKVLDPKGVHFNGAQYKQGETLASSTPLPAAVNTFLHFKQVEETDAPSAEEETADKPAEPKGKGGK